MIPIPQSTARVVMLKVFLTGTTTAATGKTLAITLSKNGGAFANPNAGATNATEVSNGWYKVTVDTTDTGTIGDLVVRGTASACDDSERLFGVVKATTGGMTALPDAVAGANGGLPVLSSSATTLAYTVSTVTTVTNQLTAAAIGAGVWDLATSGHTGLNTFGGNANTSYQIIGTNLDVVVSTRMATYTQPTGFLAATFPGTVASPTNITAGTITTTTNLTNLPAITSNWLTAAGLATDAVTEIAGGVWDLATSGHTTSGTFGAAMNAAGSAGDPMATPIPGTYGAGTAGNIIGNFLNAAITSRMATFTVPSNFASMAITAGGLVSINLAQTGMTVRALDAIADASLTVGDALVCAIAGAAGKETVVSTAYTIKTPFTGTTIRTFDLDDADAPTERT